MRTELPPSAPVARLSPTSFEILRECGLRFSFEQHRSDGPAAGTAATRLGSVCHSVLDTAVRDDLLQRDDWRQLLEHEWDTELEAERQHADAHGVSDPPAAWPGYQLKRARLFQVARRIRDFLQELPAGSELLTEEPLVTEEGLLYGRPDLIVRGRRHCIIDYKSGGVLDRDTARPREAYVHQLQLYAFLEHAVSGSWPTSAHLFPLQGAPVEIDVAPAACTDLAAQALEALAEYNACVPNTPPAAPAPGHCRWCGHATACAAFWQACDTSWATTVVAAAGEVSDVFATPLGGVTVRLTVEAGSVAEKHVAIKNIDPARFPGAAHLEAGDEIAATGLLLDQRGSGYSLGAVALVSVTHMPNRA